MDLYRYRWKWNEQSEKFYANDQTHQQIGAAHLGKTCICINSLSIGKMATLRQYLFYFLQ